MAGAQTTVIQLFGLRPLTEAQANGEDPIDLSRGMDFMRDEDLREFEQVLYPTLNARVPPSSAQVNTLVRALRCGLV